MLKLLLVGLLFSLNTYAADNSITDKLCFSKLSSGNDYELVHKTRNVSATEHKATDKKIDVVEFFWYGCSHCYTTEPFISKYAENNKDKINFVKFPVSFPGWETGTKFYYTLEAMGLQKKLNTATFEAIHKYRKDILNNPEMRKEFLIEQHVDPVKFEQLFNSFTINLKNTQSADIVKSYGLTSTPTFMVSDTYITSPSMVQSHEKAIQVIDAIVNKDNPTYCKAK